LKVKTNIFSPLSSETRDFTKLQACKMLFLIVFFGRGWDERIFPTSMKEGFGSGIFIGIFRVGGVSDHPRAAV
jgi:hypothetical protein